MDEKELKRKREVFEEWEFVMEDALADFYENIPGDLNDKLDYSVKSLDSLEKYLIDNFNRESIKEKKNMYLLDGFTRYVGETFRRNLKDAKWTINLEKDNVAYFGLPLITGAVNQFTAYCPHMDIITAVIRKNGSFLSKILENGIERQNGSK